MMLLTRRAAITNYRGRPGVVKLFFLKTAGYEEPRLSINACLDPDCELCPAKYLLKQVTSRGEPIYEEQTTDGAGSHG